MLPAPQDEKSAPPALSLAFMEDIFAKFAAAQPASRGGAALGTSRQQDASEILDFLVDEAHDELCRLRASGAGDSASSVDAGTSAAVDDDAWLEVLAFPPPSPSPPCPCPFLVNCSSPGMAALRPAKPSAPSDQHVP
jgi:hypothetical protein